MNNIIKSKSQNNKKKAPFSQSLLTGERVGIVLDLAYRKARFTALVRAKTLTGRLPPTSRLCRPLSSGSNLKIIQKKALVSQSLLTGERVGIRTRDPLIKSQMLYRLSYAPKKIPSIKINEVIYKR